MDGEHLSRALAALPGVQRVSVHRRKADPDARAWVAGTYRPSDGSAPRPHPLSEWEPWECWDVIVHGGEPGAVFAAARGLRVGGSFAVRVEP